MFYHDYRSVYRTLNFALSLNDLSFPCYYKQFISRSWIHCSTLKILPNLLTISLLDIFSYPNFCHYPYHDIDHYGASGIQLYFFASDYFLGLYSKNWNRGSSGHPILKAPDTDCQFSLLKRKKKACVSLYSY